MGKKETTDKKEKKTNPLFDIINALFTDKDYINNITEETARQNLFMVLRRIAIQYPEQANVFNDSKVNPLDVIKFFSDYLYTGGRVPSWVYTSGITKAKEKKDNKSSLQSADIKAYKQYKLMTDKDFDDYMRFFPEYIINEVNDFKELFSYR